MEKKKFRAIMLDPEYETFIIHVTSLNSIVPLSCIPLNVDVYHSCKPQIAGLIAKEVFRKIFSKYINFADVFMPDLAFKLSKHTGINNHAIKLVNSEQLFHGPIYSLGPVELEILKAYIKTNLANRFIKLSKLPTKVPIFLTKI